MLRNLQEMRVYRQGIDEVVERRKEMARKAMEELKPNPDTIKLSELKPARHLDPVEPRSRQNCSMKERIAAMEVNAESNNEALGDHRKVLDCILAVRQARKECSAFISERTWRQSINLGALSSCMRYQ